MNAESVDTIPQRLPVPQPVIDAAQLGVAEAISYLEIAHNFKIENQADADVAAEQLRGLAKFTKLYDATRLELKRPYMDLQKDIDAQFSDAMNKAKEAESLLRHEVGCWMRKQEEIAAEARRKAQADDERRRREAQEKLDQETARAANLKTEEAQQRAQERIQQAQHNADIANVSTTVVQAPPKMAGVGMRDNWQPVYDVDVLAKIVMAAAGVDKLVDPGKLRHLQLDESQIKQEVKATKENCTIPGVRAVNQKTTTVR